LYKVYCTAYNRERERGSETSNFFFFGLGPKTQLSNFLNAGNTAAPTSRNNFSFHFFKRRYSPQNSTNFFRYLETSGRVRSKKGELVAKKIKRFLRQTWLPRSKVAFSATQKLNHSQTFNLTFILTLEKVAIAITKSLARACKNCRVNCPSFTSS
jgi:hypothetical protein